MHKAMFIQLAIGLLIGGGIGMAIGYFGKCTTGACPLTANPFRGGMIGAIIGGLLALSTGSSRLGVEVEHLQIASAADFETQVLASEKPVLVDFYSTTCGPCRMLAPTISQLAEEYEGRAAVYKVNVDRLPQLAGRYGVQGVPSVLFFQNGTEVGRLVGLRTHSAYTDVLNRLIDSAT